MLDPRIQQTVRHLRSQQKDDQRRDLPPLFNATVVTATAGGSRDSNYLVQVRWFGKTITVNGYQASYTPAVNDRVLCFYDGKQVGVIGRWVGFP